MTFKLIFCFALLSTVAIAEKDASKSVENERVKKAVIIPPTVPYGYYGGGAYGYPYYAGGVYPHHGLYDNGKYHPGKYDDGKYYAGKYDDGKYYAGKYDDGKYYPGKYERVATALYKPYGAQAAAYNPGYYPYHGYYPQDYYYNKHYLPYGGHYASYPYAY